MAWISLPTPPNAHGDLNASTMAAWDGKIVLLGGYQTSAVSVYDPETNAWTHLGDLPAVIDAIWRRAVAVGDVVYWIDFTANSMRSVNMLDATTGSHPLPSGDIYDIGHLEVVESTGLIYAIGVAQVYDPSLDTWSAITPPPGPNAVSTATDQETGRIYAQGVDNFQDPWFAVYDPSLDAWTSLTPEPGLATINSAGVARAGTIIFPGGMDHLDGEPLDTVSVYDINADTWSYETPNAAWGGSVVGLASVLIPGDGEDTIITASMDWSMYTGYFHALTLEIVVPVIEAFLDVEVRIPLDLPGAEDANLTVEVDIPAGTVNTVDLLVTFHTGAPTIETSAVVVVDIPSETPPAWTPPSPVTPIGADPIVPARALSADEATTTPSFGGSDQYQFSWRPGGQLTGSAASYGESSDPQPEDDFLVEGAPEINIDWGAEPPTTRTHAWTDRTVQALNEHELPELMPEAVVNGPGTIGDCLRPHGTVLCGSVDPILSCFAREIGDEVLPTKLGLAQAAALDAGVALIILNGTSGLPSPDALVDREYRTEGRTPLQVISDMLLTGGALHWYAPGVIMVNGGGVPVGGNLARPAIRGLRGTITTTEAEPFTPDEPVLQDYLDECRDEDQSPGDPCDQETFETAFSGTLTWVETAGAGYDYTEIHTTLIKSEGRIVREEIEVHRAVWIPNTNLTSRFSGGGTRAVVPVEWTIREHTYLACCPTALAHTVETTWGTNRNYDPAATYQNATGVIITSLKDTTQVWHAEGWLRSRIETSYTHHGWQLGGDTEVIPTYKVADRSETYVPIGNGMWHINTRIGESILMPVGELDAPDPVGSHWGEVINSYVVVTDQAPPQVTCDDGADACEDGDCAALREAEYDRDHAIWESTRDAWLANHPDRITTTITYNGRVFDYLPGDITPAGIVASVAWQGAGDRTDTPGETTTVEIIGAAP